LNFGFSIQIHISRISAYSNFELVEQQVKLPFFCADLGDFDPKIINFLGSMERLNAVSSRNRAGTNGAEWLENAIVRNMSSNGNKRKILDVVLS
jgi:hypothetical protein